MNNICDNKLTFKIIINTIINFIDDQFYFELTSGFTKSNQIYVRENIVDDTQMCKNIFKVYKRHQNWHISLNYFFIFIL